MAITAPRRTIGQMAQESGYSEALAQDKYKKESSEKMTTFLEGLIKRAEKAASKKAGLSSFERLVASFIPGIGTATSLYDAYAKYQAGKNFDFNFEIPAWAKGTEYGRIMKEQATGIEAQTEGAYKKKMGTQALIAGIPAIGRGVGELGRAMNISADKLPFALNLAKAADKPIFGDMGKIGIGKLKMQLSSPRWGEAASLFADDKNLIDFLTGGETEQIVPEYKTEKTQWRNPYLRGR